MTTMADLSEDLIEEILSRVPLTSLRAIRSTCKEWNALSKKQIFGKAARTQFVGFMMMDIRVCSLSFDLQGIHNDGDELVEPCIKQVSVLDQIEVSKVFHCDGLLLWVIKDNSRLLVWNPYLGQTRWIQPRKNFHRSDRYALGYDKYRNHKILRVFDVYLSRGNRPVLGFEIYCFSSNSWKLLHVTPGWEILPHVRGVSLKGNTYFPAQKIITVGLSVQGEKLRNFEDFLLCFDFTTESFGPLLPLPFHSYNAAVFVSLSCVREEQLAVLYQRWEAYERFDICVTDKIGPNAMSWRKLLKPVLNGFLVTPLAGSFFIDEDKKVAVVFDLDKSFKECRYQTAHIIGQDGSLKSVNIGEARDLGIITGEPGCIVKGYCLPLVSSSYVPSLVQLQINQPQGIRKESHD